MRVYGAALIMASLLAACGQASNIERASTDMAAEEMAAYGGATAPVTAQAPPPMADGEADSAVDEAQRGRAEPGPGATPSDPNGPAPVLYLAYAYQMGLEIPSERLAGVMDAHVRSCQEAGPRLCQLISSSRSGDPESYLSGYVSLRGEPAWLRNFMNGVVSDTDEAGGRVQSQTTQTEDLTRQIVDTEARLRAARTLRDRLQTILANRPGRVADLLEVERELARVQAEIDATESSLAVMRTRVSMSELNVNYQSAPRAVGADTLRPLREAFANFLGIIVIGFAAIITIVAGLIPFAIVAAPLIWLALRWRKRRGGRFFGRPRESAPPPEA
ncbi:MAG: DUF4349 domain-containing protein [Hyphomonadaceae bacterium]